MKSLLALSLGKVSPGSFLLRQGATESPGASLQCISWILPVSSWQVCSFIQSAEKHWIDYQYVPYAYQGQEWVGYDDAISFSYKVRRLFFPVPVFRFSSALMGLCCILCAYARVHMCADRVYSTPGIHGY